MYPGNIGFFGRAPRLHRGAGLSVASPLPMNRHAGFPLQSLTRASRSILNKQHGGQKNTHSLVQSPYQFPIYVRPPSQRHRLEEQVISQGNAIFCKSWEHADVFLTSIQIKIPAADTYSGAIRMDNLKFFFPVKFVLSFLLLILNPSGSVVSFIHFFIWFLKSRRH